MMILLNRGCVGALTRREWMRSPVFLRDRNSPVGSPVATESIRARPQNDISEADQIKKRDNSS
eukprot:4781863-Pyramimonas_sp.AAC.1